MKCDYEQYVDGVFTSVECDQEAVYAVYAGTDCMPEMVFCEYHKPVIHDVGKERGQ